MVVGQGNRFLRRAGRAYAERAIDAGPSESSRAHAAVGAASLPNNVACDADDSPGRSSVTELTSVGSITKGFDRITTRGSRPITFVADSGPSLATAGQAGRVDVRAVLADVAGLGPYFAVGTGGPPRLTLAADGGAAGRPASRCGRASRTCGGRWTATSGWPPRSPSRGWPRSWCPRRSPRWWCTGCCPGSASRALLGRPTGTGMWSLACPDPAGDAAAEVAAGAAGLAALLLDDQLPSLVAAVRAEVPLAERVLWGNVASALAGAKRVLGRRPPGGRRPRGGAGRTAAGDRPAGRDRRAAAAPRTGSGVVVPAALVLPVLPGRRGRAVRATARWSG